MTMKQIEKITQLKILLVTNFTQHDSRNKKGYERSTVLCVSKKWDKMKQNVSELQGAETDSLRGIR